MGKLAGLLKTVEDKIKAYHASPHDFDRFSVEHIGQGEGAQVYGRGLYFGGTEDTAKFYKKSTNYIDKKRQFQKELPDDASIDEVMEMNAEGVFSPEMTELLNALDADDFLGYDYPSQAISATFSKNITDYDPSSRLLKAREGGHMYEVDIDASPDELLDWDAPVKNQSEHVKKSLNESGLLEKMRNFGGFNEGDIDSGLMTGRHILPSGRNPDTSDLKAAGIKGIQYDDGMSRGARSGNTKNYVIFDDKLISIAKKYGVTLPVASAILAGTMTPEQAQSSQDFTQRRAPKKDQWKALRESVTGAHPLESFKYPPVIEQTIEAPKSETLLTMARGAQAYNDFIDKPLINLVAPELPAELWRKQAYGQPTTLGERSLAALAMSPI